MERDQIIRNIAQWVYGHDTQYTADIIRQGLPMLSAGLRDDPARLEREIVIEVDKLTREATA